mmetsp:Transcript_26702/g.39275  ORF Transcript_26702/g.39275 Transcript_26702/m.39275 type:complete len:209 (+) Transcript_26702:641-1267(+)
MLRNFAAVCPQTHTEASKCPSETLQDGLQDVLSLLDFACEIGGDNAQGRALLTVLKDAEDFGFAGLLFCNNTVGLDLSRYLFEIRMACAEAASLFEQGGRATIIVANCIVVGRSPKTVNGVDYYRVLLQQKFEHRCLSAAGSKMERSTSIEIAKADINLVFSENADAIDVARVSILVHLCSVVIGRGIEISTVGAEESLNLLGIAHLE